MQAVPACVPSFPAPKPVQRTSVVVFGQVLHPNVFAHEIVPGFDCQGRGELLTGEGAAWGGHRLDAGRTVDVAAEEVAAFDNLIQVRIDGPGVQPETQGRIVW